MISRQELQDRFEQEVDRFAGDIDPENELDWYSLTVGFAIANGYGPDAAHEFARYIRYHTDLG